MKKLYYRIITALTLPKDDGGYSTETVIITAVLIGLALGVTVVIGDYVTEQIALIGA